MNRIRWWHVPAALVLALPVGLWMGEFVARWVWGASPGWSLLGGADGEAARTAGPEGRLAGTRITIQRLRIPLGEVATIVQDRTGLPVLIDPVGRAEPDGRPLGELEVALWVTDMSALNVLRVATQSRGLGFKVAYGCVLISRQDRLEAIASGSWRVTSAADSAWKQDAAKRLGSVRMDLDAPADASSVLQRVAVAAGVNVVGASAILPGIKLPVCGRSLLAGDVVSLLAWVLDADPVMEADALHFHARLR
ncbi:MAG: hypothetical protein HYZ53_02950 [Planctomycetes bacterium]|nr:hypothetical protein [Planctomycetota bacterium]